MPKNALKPTPLFKKIPRELWFIGVGGCAALVHLITVYLIVEHLKFNPLLANIGAFLLAFSVSYSGHAFLTFADHAAPHIQALPRFFLVACCGFTLNELLYSLLLNIFHFSYLPTLFFVLIFIAVMTYFAAQRWAFFNPKSSPN
jgi:putative flippase GtrA